MADDGMSLRRMLGAPDAQHGGWPHTSVSQIASMMRRVPFFREAELPPECFAQVASWFELCYFERYRLLASEGAACHCFCILAHGTAEAVEATTSTSTAASSDAAAAATSASASPRLGDGDGSSDGLGRGRSAATTGGAGGGAEGGAEGGSAAAAKQARPWRRAPRGATLAPGSFWGTSALSALCDAESELPHMLPHTCSVRAASGQSGPSWPSEAHEKHPRAKASQQEAAHVETFAASVTVEGPSASDAAERP